MIHFRFHVVSIIAIFLALAIGTVLGSAFVGKAVIDRLQNRIDEVGRSVVEERAENEDLTEQIRDLERYTDQSAHFVVANSLTDVTVNLVAERGVDGGTVDAQAALIREAGATVPGVIWLEAAWNLDSPEQAAALRQATGLTNRSPDALRTAAAGLLGQRLATGPPGAVPGADTPDLLANLVESGLVALEPAGGESAPVPADFGGDPARTLVIGSPESDLRPEVVPGIAHGLVDNAGMVAVGQVFIGTEQFPDRSTWINAIADEDGLRNEISTIDGLDRVEGRVGATLALAELGSGTVGNYGMDRDRAVPEQIPVVPAAR